MKIVFFGSSEFAVQSLKRLLISPYEVLGVVTQPDRQKGRHLKVQPTPVKKATERLKVPLCQPENLNDPKAIKYLKSFSADLFVVVGYGEILPKRVLSIPKLYSINLHPSLLPKYRGAAPVNWVIIKGETKTGLTVIRMNERMDAGDIILQREVDIEKEDTSESLNKRLSELGAILLQDALKFIDEGRAKFKKQDEKKRSLAPMLKKEDGLIDWNMDAVEIHNRVRGVLPWPGAYTYFENEKIKILETSLLDGTASPGEVVEADKNLVIGTKKGLLAIAQLQLEGKKRMASGDFLRGFRGLEKGVKFGTQG